MVELQQLKQLVTVYECGTMSAAAQQLHISQPALSRSIQRLEDALAVQLFDHARNKTRMNAVGILAVDRARAILKEVEELSPLLQAYAQSLLTISVGSCAPAPIWFLTEVLGQAFPDMSIDSELADHDQLLDGLQEDYYQLIITEKPIQLDGILCRKHATEMLYLSVPYDHPLAGRDSVRLDDLSGLTMLIHNELGLWQRLIDKAVNVHFIVQKEHSVLLELVDASALPCFITNMSRAFLGAPANRAEIPITDEDASVVFYLCAKESAKHLLDELSPSVSAL